MAPDGRSDRCGWDGPEAPRRTGHLRLAEKRTFKDCSDIRQTGAAQGSRTENHGGRRKGVRGERRSGRGARTGLLVRAGRVTRRAGAGASRERVGRAVLAEAEGVQAPAALGGVASPTAAQQLAAQGARIPLLAEPFRAGLGREKCNTHGMRSRPGMVRRGLAGQKDRRPTRIRVASDCASATGDATMDPLARKSRRPTGRVRLKLRLGT